MGADGHIQIWRDDVVRKKFPDCDKLFSYLPTHYADELDGIKYHHCYWGDNLWCSWRDSDNWYLSDEGKDFEEHLAKFVEWLDNQAPSAHWEVWT